MATQTRKASPAKPADHKPAKTSKVSVEYEGVKYEVSPGGLTNLNVLDLLERGQITSALRFLISDEKFVEFLASVTDEDGYADVEHAGELMELIGEKVGAKNS